MTEVRYFWCVDSGWGMFSYAPGRSIELRVLYGELRLNVLRLPFLPAEAVASVDMEGREVGFQFLDGELRLGDGVRLGQGGTIVVRLG